MSLINLIFANKCIHCHHSFEKLTAGFCSDCFFLMNIYMKKKDNLIYFIDYKNEQKYFIYQAKEHNKPHYLKKVSMHCGILFENSNPLSGVITCVPIHKNEMSRRGFNQSEIIARQFAKATGFKMRELLMKIKKTEKQKNLNFQQRKENLSDAFISKVKNLAYPLVYLVDDICTTGSTLNECKKTLLKAGVEEVVFITLAYVKKT